MSQRIIYKRGIASGQTVYIPINRYAQNINIQISGTGGANVGVDYTLDNVLRQPSSFDPNNEEFVAAGSAQWTQLIAVAAAPLAFVGQLNAMCLRVVVSVGGTADIKISQSSEII